MVTQTQLQNLIWIWVRGGYNLHEIETLQTYTNSSLASHQEEFEDYLISEASVGKFQHLKYNNNINILDALISYVQ